MFNSKKLNGDTHTSTKRERERERRREREAERERDFIKLVVEKEREKMSKSGMSSAAKRIQKELAEISLEPPTNCSAGPKGDNLYEWVSTIMGPPGTNSSSHSSSFFVFFSLSFRERVHTTTKFKKKSYFFSLKTTTINKIKQARRITEASSSWTFTTRLIIHSSLRKLPFVRGFTTVTSTPRDKYVWTFSKTSGRRR